MQLEIVQTNMRELTKNSIKRSIEQTTYSRCYKRIITSNAQITVLTKEK